MMNPKTLAPQLQPPVERVPTGQLPSALAELSEAALNVEDILVSFLNSDGLIEPWYCSCSYDGDDE
jgi:bacteriocin leader peptide (microcyclamide/patellamide family)